MDTTAAEKPVKARERKVIGKVEVDMEKCKGCELCTVACKEGGLTLSKSLNAKGYRYIIADNTVCTGCVNCALVCPDGVITVYRTNPKKNKMKNVTNPEIYNSTLKPILSSPAYPDLMSMDYI
jgi:2-oxoglutarate ferredoxin oxidoreductase subunit delta